MRFGFGIEPLIRNPPAAHTRGTRGLRYSGTLYTNQVVRPKAFRATRYLYAGKALFTLPRLPKVIVHLDCLPRSCGQRPLSDNRAFGAFVRRLKLIQSARRLHYLVSEVTTVTDA